MCLLKGGRGGWRNCARYKKAKCLSMKMIVRLLRSERVECGLGCTYHVPTDI